MPISPRASPIGLPALRASSTARSSARSSSASRQPAQQADALGRGHRAPRRERLLRAAATAASVSSTPARGSSAITCSVAGSTTGITRATSVAQRHQSPITRLFTSSSGCQSTPSANGGPPSRSPPPASSGSGPAGRRQRPRPARRRPGGGATSRQRARAPAARAASEPGSRRTSWSPNAPGVWRCRSSRSQVLLERPAAGHVEHLHPAADAQHGHVTLERAVGQRELEAVALGPGPVGLGVGLARRRSRGPRRRPRRGSARPPGRAAVGRLRRAVVRRAGSAPARRPRWTAARSVRGDRSTTASQAPRDLLDGGADADDRPAHSRSKPRNCSQSVTAASNGASSTSRMVQVVVHHLLAERLARDSRSRRTGRARRAACAGTRGLPRLVRRCPRAAAPAAARSRCRAGRRRSSR